jgi:hypothetical protein
LVVPIKKNTIRHVDDTLKTSIMNNRGGQKVIERILSAYGFTSRQAFCNHLGISQSTMANRYARDTFPADWVPICSLETGASLLWLTNWTGPKFSNAFHSVSFIKKQQLAKGILQDEGYIAIDKSLLATGVKEPIAISVDNAIYIVDTIFNEISDGDWLVEIEGKFHIKKLTRKPVGKVIVSGLGSTFECQLNELKICAKCHSVFINYN